MWTEKSSVTFDAVSISSSPKSPSWSPSWSPPRPPPSWSSPPPSSWSTRSSPPSGVSAVAGSSISAALLEAGSTCSSLQVRSSYHYITVCALSSSCPHIFFSLCYSIEMWNIIITSCQPVFMLSPSSFNNLADENNDFIKISSLILINNNCGSRKCILLTISMFSMFWSQSQWYFLPQGPEVVERQWGVAGE